MTRKQLQAAGTLAMTSALLAIPWFLVVYATEDHHAVETRLLQGSLLACGTALFVYLILMLRRLLHLAFSFSAANRPIDLLIKGNIVVSATGLLGLAVPPLESSIAIVTILFAIPLGLAQVWFGKCLLEIPHELYGLRRPYAWLNIITGICQSSVVLMPIALFTGAVADVMLGTMFLQTAAHLRKK